MFSILLAVLLLLIGCSAPHDNPLDPRSEHFVPPTGEPYVPEFTARVWSEHLALGSVSETVRARVEFVNPDTTFPLQSVWMVYDGRTADSVSGAQPVWGETYQASTFNCGGTNVMECAIGVPFDFLAYDFAGNVYRVGPCYLFRVIGSLPLTSEPDSQDVVGPHVILEWPYYAAYFPYQVQAQITDRTGYYSVWGSPLLPQQQQLVVVTDSLADGDYKWTLTVRDEFGNIARSREAEFRVQAGAPL